MKVSLHVPASFFRWVESTSSLRNTSERQGEPPHHRSLLLSINKDGRSSESVEISAWYTDLLVFSPFAQIKKDTLVLNDTIQREIRKTWHSQFYLSFQAQVKSNLPRSRRRLAAKVPQDSCIMLRGPIEGGWRVVDVWESQEAVETFFQETLGQVLQEAGIAIPVPQFWPAQRIIKPETSVQCDV